jgi:hypothetical protein
MPLVVATRAKLGPNLLSLSRMRYFGVCPYGVASRSCCATQGPVGERVTFTWMTFRDCNEGVEKRKKRTEEEIRDLEEITGPDLWRMIAQERSPGLSSRPCGTNELHILLNSSFTHPNIHLEQLATNALSSPEAVVCCHLLHQSDRLGRKPRLSRMRPRFALPEHTEELTMEAEEASSSWTRKSACFQVRTILASSTRRSRSLFL